MTPRASGQAAMRPSLTLTQRVFGPGAQQAPAPVSGAGACGRSARSSGDACGDGRSDLQGDAATGAGGDADRASCASGRHHLLLLGARCDSAEPAAVLDALLVRPSRSTLDAAFAALALVVRCLAVMVFVPFGLVR